MSQASQLSTTVLAADNFLLPNGTFFAELVAFVIILFVLWRYVVPPLTKSLQDRQDMVTKQVQDFEQAQHKLRQAEERYDEALAEARVEAAKIRDGARADGERIRAELRERADAEVERIRQRGEEQLSAQRDQVVRQLRGELGGLAIQLAERLVGQELSDEKGKRATIDRFLRDLDDLPTDDSAEDTAEDRAGDTAEDTAATAEKSGASAGSSGGAG